jgi:alkylation response protein AidB-like acyl-CoA dehydrogenase
MRRLAKAHVSYRAHMQLGFFVIALLRSSEMKVKPSLAPPHYLPKNLHDVQCLLGLLGLISKATTAKATLIGSQTAMESLGGVGYLENEEIECNVARLARDCAVLCTGEGTTDVLATDVGKGSGER